MDILTNLLAEQGQHGMNGTGNGQDGASIEIAAWRNACRRADLTNSDNPETQKRVFNRTVAELSNMSLIERDEESAWIPA